MYRLLACTCLTSVLIIGAAAPARAETTIGNKITNNVRTSTANNGGADDIRITADGSVEPASGVGVTVDSNDNVKNEGDIIIKNANDSAGILALPGFSGTITSSGSIKIIEDYSASDPDNDGDNDGAFASGARRFGIRVAPGGTFTGDIVNSGTIDVEGNDSAGISIESRLAGSLSSSGAIAVIGDRSFGIRAGDVTGDVRITGSVEATGAGSLGVALGGDVGGALVIQGSIVATGYRYKTSPSDPSKLDADDLLQGGPALQIAGDVSKGILLDARPADRDANDKDEDDDGIEDDKEGNANVVSYGGAPAVQIGAADQAVTIGAVAGNANGHGIVINGAAAGAGVYKGVAASGLVIGGLGGAVNVAGGLTVNGTVGAIAKGAGATGIRIGNGATVNEISIGRGAAVSGEADNDAASIARALVIDEGATVTAIRSAGRVTAKTGADGRAIAILDRSGKVGLVENSGTIEATGASADSGRAIAIDLSANSSGATVRQTQVEQGVAAPSVTGDILFGAGNDLLDLADGGVKGATQFGAGANRLSMAGDAAYTGKVQFGAGADRMALEGSSVFSGTADFGGGADSLAIAGTARFSGRILNGAALAVDVGGGTLEMTEAEAVSIASLNVGGQGVLGATVDTAAGTSTLYNVAGAAAFAEGAKIQVKLTSVGGALGTYKLLKAGTLTGTSGLSSASILLPVFLKGNVSADEQAGEISFSISRKSAAEIGLNGSETSAWDAIYAALDQDEEVADVFLGMSETEVLQETLQQMLPDHAGGVFETVTQGSRATARILRDPSAPYAERGAMRFWLQQVAWGTSKDLGDTSAYDISGWGVSGGAEARLGDAGSAGLSLAFLGGRDANGENDNEVRADQYELGAHWRGEWGGLRAHARLSAAHISLEGSRTFSGTIGDALVTRTSEGDWNARLFSAAAGVSYEVAFGRLSLRPAVAIDYYRLSEDGYEETGGGEAMDLIVEDRSSDEAAAEASLAAGYDIDDLAGGSWLRLELEGGRRQIVGGSMGETVARFAEGDPFTLRAEERSDGWTGKLRLVGGSADFTAGGEFSAEEQQGRAAIAFRVGLQFGM